MLGIDLRDHKMNTVEWLKKRWLSVGIEKGDTLLLHSNIIRTLGVLRRNGYEPSANAILESFVQSVGEQGTYFFHYFISILQMEFNSISELLDRIWVR